MPAPLPTRKRRTCAISWRFYRAHRGVEFVYAEGLGLGEESRQKSLADCTRADRGPHRGRSGGFRLHGRDLRQIVEQESWPFRDEWYTLEPFPTRVKFLLAVDEKTLTTRAQLHPGHGDLHPGRVVSVLRRRSRVAHDARARRCSLHRRLTVPRAARIRATRRERNRVHDGIDPVLHEVSVLGRALSASSASVSEIAAQSCRRVAPSSHRPAS